MKRTIYILIFIIAILVFASCKNRERKDTTILNSKNFAIVTSAKTESIQLPDSISIKDWVNSEDEILCLTEKADYTFSILSLNSLKPLNSFGKRGHGPQEMMHPHVLVSDNGNFSVLDNGKRKIYEIENMQWTNEKDIYSSDAFNLPKVFGDSLIVYQEATPNVLRLKVYNPTASATQTVTSFPETENADNSDLFDFVFDTHENLIVTANLYADKFTIIEIGKDTKPIRKTKISGNDRFNPNRIAYSDIICDDVIYLLCQENVDVNDYSGFSTIEIYDYSGNPVKKINLDIIADKVILDKERQRIICTSPSDENLHILQIK